MSTVDNNGYYKRHNVPDKVAAVKAFVDAHPDIRSVFDVGCNTGRMSAQFMPRLCTGGIDLADGLQMPPGYAFRHADVIKDRIIDTADCTLFLSLYHHLLGAYGLAEADRIFYQCLIRSKYLVFDTGNTSETARRNTDWYKKQAAVFANEKALLDHFGLPYTVHGQWAVAQGYRTIVSFNSTDFDTNVKVVDAYLRRPGSSRQREGLHSYKKNPGILKAGQANYHQYTHFFKLQLGSHLFFGKKHTVAELNAREFANTRKAYRALSAALLVPCYGLSACYGLLFDWLPKLTYVRKIHDKYVGVNLVDSDLIMVNGSPKVIDFFVLDRWKDSDYTGRKRRR